MSQEVFPGGRDWFKPRLPPAVPANHTAAVQVLLKHATAHQFSQNLQELGPKQRDN